MWGNQLLAYPGQFVMGLPAGVRFVAAEGHMLRIHGTEVAFEQGQLHRRRVMKDPFPGRDQQPFTRQLVVDQFRRRADLRAAPFRMPSLIQVDAAALRRIDPRPVPVGHARDLLLQRTQQTLKQAVRIQSTGPKSAGDPQLDLGSHGEAPLLGLVSTDGFGFASHRWPPRKIVCGSVLPTGNRGRSRTPHAVRRGNRDRPPGNAAGRRDSAAETDSGYWPVICRLSAR
jgi:hypothetical protein